MAASLMPLFALTLLLSATLLFLVQPMVGKLVLPYLGGSPSVWNTCMVFYQAMLLAGYTYAHLVTRWFRPKIQMIVHAAFLFVALTPLFLIRFDVGFIAANWLPPPREDNPIPWLLLMLFLTAGLPFFVVSTSAPLLQRWFTRTGHPSAQDPYFLYAASNLGSLLALLSYPTIIEPNLGLVHQAHFWSLAYAGLVLCTLLCGVYALRLSSDGRFSTDSGDEMAPSLLRRCRWVALAFVPSSLMIGVTTFLTTDLAAMPLLWILPLTVYLLSFVLVFSPAGRWVHAAAIVLLPFVIVALALEFDLIRWYQMKVYQRILIHLLAVFVASIVCHGELARTRPAASHLTGFYLFLSFGGVLGGIFNSLIAPLTLDRVAEYPLVIVLALVLMPLSGFGKKWSWLWGIEIGFACCLTFLGLLAGCFFWAQSYLTPTAVYTGVNYIPDSVRPSVGWLIDRLHNDTALIYRERNFFGTFAVRSYYGRYHLMSHGTTTHGFQDRNEPSEPLSYFHRTGAIGQLFESAELKNTGKPLRVAVLGIGTGTLSAYMKREGELTLYEIDPAVVRLARNPDYFTYLTDAEDRGVKIDVVLGDGRLRMHDAPDNGYDLIFMDAFTSDAVPVHLLTREAMQIYFRKLAPRGIVVVNIANRYLTLDAVLGNLADDLGIAGYAQYGDEDWSLIKFASVWVVLARKQEDFGDLLGKTDGENNWQPLERNAKVGVWTDDYSNLLRVFEWQR